MKSINGNTIFNSMPHPVTFLFPDGKEIKVFPDAVISARWEEEHVENVKGAELVSATPLPTEEGYETIKSAKAAGADIIAGSIVAAQAYPGDVVAMVDHPDYFRMPPEEKRVLPDKFTVFPKQQWGKTLQSTIGELCADRHTRDFILSSLETALVSCIREVIYLVKAVGLLLDGGEK